MNPKILAIGLAMLCVSARAADLIPVEDFARFPTHSSLQLSPDGQFCASLRAVDGRNFIEFLDLAAGSVQKFDPGRSAGGRIPGGELRSVLRFRWLGSRRVLAYFQDGSAAFDRDGKNWKPISGGVAAARSEFLGFKDFMLNTGKEHLVAGDLVYLFNDDVHALMLRQRAQGTSINVYPEVINMNMETGSFETVVTNPGGVIEWISDRKGVVRAGLRYGSIDDISLIYREDEKSPWRPVGSLPGARKERPRLHGFSADGKGVYVSATDASGFRALYLFDIVSGTHGEPVLRTPGYDVGLSGGGIWSEHKQALIGFSYATEGPHMSYFDEEFAQRMAEVDRVLPNTFNKPVSISGDDQRILIHASSDRNPGAYYLYSADSKKLQPILRTRPWIKPEQMASMNPITYLARDGVEIRGYLTIPVGQQPRLLPFVVLPHDGPFEVRDQWGFNPLVQMLANRGYAVLQANFRGSTGLGSVFAEKGEREVGGAIQRDIEDATRWAIAKKVADPKRVAIVGVGRFGGYSALYALGKSPGLYCCGVTMHGVVDWLDVYRNISGPGRLFVHQSFKKMVGDPETEEEKFKAISPVNFADEITAPVLFIYPNGDQYVYPRLVRKMSAACRKAGGNPEMLFVDDASNAGERLQIEKYKAIEAFLAKHLGTAAGTEPGTRDK